MCGRFAYFGSGRFEYPSLHLPEVTVIYERYNIAPSEDVLAIRLSPATEQPEFILLHWGLVPFWSKINRTKFPLINARVEGIENMPSFRGPFKHRRCIIPASGFYAWRRQGTSRQPYFIRPRDCGYLALAGIWDYWHGDEGVAFNSCAILTTQANETIRSIHDRMPVVLAPKDVAVWLDPPTEERKLLALLRPYPSELIEAYPVSVRINNPRNNGPECITKVEMPEEAPAQAVDIGPLPSDPEIPEPQLSS